MTEAECEIMMTTTCARCGSKLHEPAFFSLCVLCDFQVQAGCKLTDECMSMADSFLVFSWPDQMPPLRSTRRTCSSDLFYFRLLDKLPKLDLTWPARSQETWWAAYKAIHEAYTRKYAQ